MKNIWTMTLFGIVSITNGLIVEDAMQTTTTL